MNAEGFKLSGNKVRDPAGAPSFARDTKHAPVRLIKDQKYVRPVVFSQFRSQTG